MSSHRLSVSGQREYTLTAGGGQMSAAQFPARQEDAIHVNLGGVVTEIPLSPHAEYRGHPDDEPRPSVRIERRVYQEATSPGQTVQHVLVIEGSATVWATPARGAFPHSNVDVRRPQGNQNPIQYGRELVSSEIVEALAIPAQEYVPAEGQLTEDNLIKAMIERGIQASDDSAPKVLAVADRRMELIARRILHSTENAEGTRASDYSKLAGLPVEIDHDLPEHGWELR